MEQDVVRTLDPDRFNLIMDILKILERHEEDPEIKETAMEIIENYDGLFSQDQKAEVLEELLHFTRREHEDKQKRLDALEEQRRRREMEDFGRLDYF
jgi:hypothetical protein